MDLFKSWEKTLQLKNKPPPNVFVLSLLAGAQAGDCKSAMPHFPPCPHERVPAIVPCKLQLVYMAQLRPLGCGCEFVGGK